MKKDLKEFLKILEIYRLKSVPRDNSNHYKDEKDNVFYNRRETTAEHVFSSLRLADYFISAESEFKCLSREHVYELLMYHDDAEIITGDIGLIDKKRRKNKEADELKAIPKLAAKYPKHLGKKLKMLDFEKKKKKTPEAKFAKAIDKLDAMIHELPYKKDWGAKGWTEKMVKDLNFPSFAQSKTLKRYFDSIVLYTVLNGYYKK